MDLLPKDAFIDKHLLEMQMTEDEQEQMHAIFKFRSNLLSSASLLMTLIGLFASVRVWGAIDVFPGTDMLGELIFWIAFSFAFVFVFYLLIYHKKIKPYRRDWKEGKKWKVNCEVVSKPVFHNGRYYLGINLAGYPYHEVPEEEYRMYGPGDVIYIYCAKHSRYIFNAFGKIILM